MVEIDDRKTTVATNFINKSNIATSNFYLTLNEAIKTISRFPTLISTDGPCFTGQLRLNTKYILNDS